VTDGICPFNFSLVLKIFTLDDCPMPTNKKKLCIQPVFVRTGPTDASPTGSSAATVEQAAKDLWAKGCVELQINDPIYVDDATLKSMDDITKDAAGHESSAKEDTLLGKVDPKGDNDCLEVFFVDQMVDTNGNRHSWGDGDTKGGRSNQGSKIVVADDAN